MFSKEKLGLELLLETGALTVPNVQKVYEGVEYSSLALEYLESAPRRPNYWEALGRGLAQLHSVSTSVFGLDHDNYMGSLEQYNRPGSDWVEFFINQRIRPQVELGLTKGSMQSIHAKHIEALYSKLPDLLPTEVPSLVHGDLWSGNIMVGNKGEPAIIDPAVSFAHREIDIAMTQLFGSLPDRFYKSYNEAKPMEPGWQQRIDIYNLYPLLVHVNLFGGGYLSQAMQIVKRYH